MKKFGSNGQLRNELYLIVIYHFSLVKAAMIALRICKLRNFFFFQWKDLIQVRNEYSLQLSKLLHDCKFKNEALSCFRGRGAGGFF
jgi:hypothetical protein